MNYHCNNNVKRHEMKCNKRQIKRESDREVFDDTMWRLDFKSRY